MSRGARMRRQEDDGCTIRFAPRENEKPSAESERAQRWRLSLASLLFITVLLSDHLWFCAEAKLTRTRDKRSDEEFAITDTGGEHPNSQHPQHHHHHPAPQPDPNSLAGEEDAIFLGNSTRPLWRTPCPPDSPPADCRGSVDAAAVCQRLSAGGDGETRPADVELSDLYLSFCNSYSLLDLFYGFTSPEDQNCTLEDARGPGCGQCVAAYQRLDRQAEEDYREFELLVQKYETDAYSVRTCMDECKAVYRPWICSQYFQTSQTQCSSQVPCAQYCLEVQQRCPFILPDNDDLVHGGTPSFICTGLLESYPAGSDPDAVCCDVRWAAVAAEEARPGPAPQRSHPSCQHRTSLSSSSSSCRLRLCLLVLVLLHTVASLTAMSHNATGLGLPAIPPLEESPANEE